MVENRLVIYGGTLLLVVKHPGEDDSISACRAWSLARVINREEPTQRLVNLSKCYANRKVKGVTYNKEIEDELDRVFGKG